MFIVVPLIRSTGLATLQKRICAVVFLSEKVVVTVLTVFLSFVLTTRYSLNFHEFERQSCLFELIMLFHLLMLPGSA